MDTDSANAGSPATASTPNANAQPTQQGNAVASAPPAGDAPTNGRFTNFMATD